MEVLLESRLRADRQAPRVARSQARDALAARVGGVALDAVLLVLSELVTNAALHVGGAVRVRLLTRPGVLRVEVEDGSERLPLLRRSLGRSEVSGRGLPLIAAMARGWGADPISGGKRVWVDLDAGVRPLPSFAGTDPGSHV